IRRASNTPNPPKTSGGEILRASSQLTSVAPVLRHARTFRFPSVDSWISPRCWLSDPSGGGIPRCPSSMEAAGSSSSRPPKRRRPGLRPSAPLEVAGARTPYMPSLCTNSKNPSTKCYGDRFIPDRSAMDMDMAYYLLTEPKKGKENEAVVSPAKEAYRRLLAEKLLGSRTRILAFRNKPPEPEGMLPQILFETPTSSQTKPTKQRRKIPQFAERTLDAPGVVDDYYLNMLDWGSKNVVSVALENTLYLWNASDSSTSELVTVDADYGPITSVSWACEGQHIAVGLNSSDIQLWDTSSNRMVSSLDVLFLVL
uniref:Uncharacterized protein n=1 Tax=Aegilops tauschii subsp. strangulata TaxID=200361 RepID=A0A453KNE0_AEGTS